MRSSNFFSYQWCIIRVSVVASTILMPPTAQQVSVGDVIHERNQLLQQYVAGMRVRDRRFVFTHIENHGGVTHNTFLPHYGIRVGEFAVNYILGDKTYRTRRMRRKRDMLTKVQGIVK